MMHPLNTIFPIFLLTGVASPVIELSSTAALPLTTSPSRGICSPAHTNIIVAISTVSTGTVSLVSAITATFGVVKTNAIIIRNMKSNNCGIKRPNKFRANRLRNANADKLCSLTSPIIFLKN